MHRPTVLAANAFCFILGVIIGIWIADYSSATNFLREWQTLVTGIIALIGAALTIRAMVHTEAQQQVRHNQLVQLQLRRDALILDRAAYPLAVDLRMKASHIRRKIADLPDHETSTRLLVELVEDVRQIGVMVANDHHLGQAKPLLDSFASRSLEILLENTEAIDSFEYNLRGEDRAGNYTRYTTVASSNWEDLRFGCVRWANAVVENAETLASELIAMVKMYEPGLAALREPEI